MAVHCHSRNGNGAPSTTCGGIATATRSSLERRSEACRLSSDSGLALISLVALMPAGRGLSAGTAAATGSCATAIASSVLTDCHGRSRTAAQSLPDCTSCTRATTRRAATPAISQSVRTRTTCATATRRGAHGLACCAARNGTGRGAADACNRYASEHPVWARERGLLVSRKGRQDGWQKAPGGSLGRGN